MDFKFVYAFISSVSMSISLIPFLISKILSNSSKNFNKSKEFNKFKKFLFIIISTLQDHIISLMYHKLDNFTLHLVANFQKFISRNYAPLKIWK